MNWFLYKRELCHERVNSESKLRESMNELKQKHWSIKSDLKFLEKTMKFMNTLINVGKYNGPTDSRQPYTKTRLTVKTI